MRKYACVIIGGGPAGLGAALKLFELGIQDILIVERDVELGGILQQCIHNGFGLHYFKEELTGPTYAQRFIDQIEGHQIPYQLNTMVLEITPDKCVHMISREKGYQIIEAETIILAMGCRERTAGAISLPGTRPTGIITAGTAQYLLNIKGYMVGKKVFILGSGDIGLIMARRMTLEGAQVVGVAELMPYSNGLNRNIVQCLHDFDIPLYLSHTVVDVRGVERVSGITIAQVNDQFEPILGTEVDFEVDTLLLSVGLIPENELSDKAGVALDLRTKGPMVDANMATSIEGVFACGNVVHVHDLVDYVTRESHQAARGVARYLGAPLKQGASVDTVNLEGIAYVVPQRIDLQQFEKEPTQLLFRVKKQYEKAVIEIRYNDQLIKEIKKQHLAPAEMESVLVQCPSDLEMKPGRLTVGLKEVAVWVN